MKLHGKQKYLVRERGELNTARLNNFPLCQGSHNLFDEKSKTFREPFLMGTNEMVSFDKFYGLLQL